MVVSPWHKTSRWCVRMPHSGQRIFLAALLHNSLLLEWCQVWLCDVDFAFAPLKIDFQDDILDFCLVELDAPLRFLMFFFSSRVEHKNFLWINCKRCSFIGSLSMRFSFFPSSEFCMPYKNMLHACMMNAFSNNFFCRSRSSVEFFKIFCLFAFVRGFFLPFRLDYC